MDWRAIDFDWNQARAFLVTADEGSLSAAARALRLTQPTVGRQVAALEIALGVELFVRAGRGLELTPAGLELAEHARAMGAAAMRLSTAATGQSQTVEGQICIGASEIYAAQFLPPILGELRSAYPGIEVEIVATNAVSDLRRREADIAIRNARPDDPDLFARHVADDSATLFAAPEYLAGLGDTIDAERLSGADFLGFDSTRMLVDGLNALGLSLAPGNFPLLCKNHLVLWEMAKAGLGIGIFPVGLGRREPGLVEVMPGLPPISYPVWLVSHGELKTSRRVRLVFDHLARALPRVLAG